MVAFPQLHLLHNARGPMHTMAGGVATSDYFYDAIANYNLPNDHMVIVGTQKYYKISIMSDL